MSQLPNATFNPDWFTVTDPDHAMLATVGPIGFEDGDLISAEARWEWDTPYTLDEIARHLRITAQSVVLDYGCGTGRIAKALIGRFGCRVVGVDASESMRNVALQYVDSPRFSVCDGNDLSTTPGLFDCAVCLWVLQHSGYVLDDAKRIFGALKPNAGLLVFNENIRFVPTHEFGFANDGLDVRAALKTVFGDPEATGKLDPQRVPCKFSERTFWGLYRMGQTFSYDRARFDVGSVAAAKALILTPEDSTTEHRWVTETPYLADLIGTHLNLSSARVLDYGCGIGRMAKELIPRHNCTVVGVDTSMNMRALAPTYVLDDRFVACAPSALDAIASVHYAISIWSLQHIPDLGAALAAISRKLRSYGALFVMNTHHRCIPIQGGAWIDDGVDVREMLGVHFKEVAYGVPDATHTTPGTPRVCFWGVYQRRE